jgi:hypothetical protein
MKAQVKVQVTLQEFRSIYALMVKCKLHRTDFEYEVL